MTDDIVQERLGFRTQSFRISNLLAELSLAFVCDLQETHPLAIRSDDSM